MTVGGNDDAAVNPVDDSAVVAPGQFRIVEGGHKQVADEAIGGQAA